MFQFRRFPTYAYFIQRTLTEYCSAGFPHSEILGSKPMCGSPRLIAACHVLRRLLMPRHSPCALYSLTLSKIHFWFYFWSRIMQASEFLANIVVCYPILKLKLHNLNHLPSLLLALYIWNFLFLIVQFSRCSLSGLSWNQIQVFKSLEHLYLFSMVEISGIEPLTPCLQSRCSPSWAIPPYLPCYSALWTSKIKQR